MISLLVRASEESVLVRAMRRSGGASQAVYENSFTGRTIGKISSLVKALLEKRGGSLFSHIFSRFISLVSFLLSKTRLHSPMLGRVAQESKLLDGLLSPWSFFIMTLAFFAVARVSYSFQTLYLISLALFSFSIGVCWGRLESSNLRPKVRKTLILNLGLIMFLLGILGFFLQILRAGGIPITNEELRRRLSPWFNYLAWTSVPGTMYVLSALDGRGRRFKAKLLILTSLGFLPTFLLGYRTEMIAYLIGVLTVAYYKRFVEKPTFPTLLCLGIVIYFLVSFVRLTFTGLVASPFATAAYRPTVTASFLESIVKEYGLSGPTKGTIHLSTFSSIIKWIPGPRYGPRTIIGLYAGGRRGVSTTATILAQFLLDFGQKGVILGMLGLGLLLSLCFEMAAKESLLLGPYATLLSYSIVGVETGILDLNVVGYMLTSLSVLLSSLRLKEEA